MFVSPLTGDVAISGHWKESFIFDIAEEYNFLVALIFDEDVPFDASDWEAGSDYMPKIA